MSQCDSNTGVIALLSEVPRLIREDFRRRAQHLGLTQPQWRVLMQLNNEPGLKQATLAERLEVHPVTVTQIIDRLVAAGWVRRDRSETDRRAVSLYLTEAAQPILVELNSIATVTREDALAGLNKAQRAELENLLFHIKGNFCTSEKSSSEKSSSERSNSEGTGSEKSGSE